VTQQAVREIRQIVDQILAIPGQFTSEALGRACACTLAEVVSSNKKSREFEAHPEHGSFAIISFRGPASPKEDPSSLVIMKVREGVRLTQADLQDAFEFSMEGVDINPMIPPEGTISFRQSHDIRKLLVQFTYRSRTLRQVAVHENP